VSVAKTNLDATGQAVQRNYSNGFLKLSLAPNRSVSVYPRPSNTVQESEADEDLGLGGALVLPDAADASGPIVRLALGAGKESILDVVNRADGQVQRNRNNIHQEIR
jgi:hypothetical protein